MKLHKQHVDTVRIKAGRQGKVIGNVLKFDIFDVDNNFLVAVAVPESKIERIWMHYKTVDPVNNFPRNCRKCWLDSLKGYYIRYHDKFDH